MGFETDFNFIRKRITDAKDLKKLEEIEKDWVLVRKHGKIIKSRKIFSIGIGKHFFWLRKNSASSSVDTYLEIFKHKDHMKIPEFLGKKDKIIFDVGANEGFYTVGMKTNNPNLKIVAIEPAPSTFSLLKKNILRNKLTDVILINQALTSREGRISFEIFPGVTSVGGLDIAFQKRPWLDTKRIERVTVKSTTLPILCDKLKIKGIDILKLDVEGSELDILKSSKEILKNIKKIVIEWHSKQLRNGCINFLRKNGFKLIHEDRRTCGDIYFKRNH